MQMCPDCDSVYDESDYSRSQLQRGLRDLTARGILGKEGAAA